VPAKWYAGGIIHRVIENGTRKYLVIDTRSTHPKYSSKPMQTKFCGGTEENHEREDTTILKTLHREIFEETDMQIRDGAELLLVQSETLPGHFKNFYDINFDDLVGKLRTTEKEIEFDWMSVPYWVTYEQACRILFRSHQAALMKSEQRYQESLKRSREKATV
jgi:hypothetical protein